ncbi:DUF5673 domain-containing protein [uncultured Gimesia sp.]|nr:hypothetical protein [Gimesia sp.]HBL45740.1 hypothetical protein [Planctomycetaceae bacterium]
MKAEINESREWRENGNSASQLLIGIVVIQGTLTILISYFFQASVGDGIRYSGIIIGYPFFCWFLISWIRSLRNRGSTLLDCGRSRVEPAAVLLAILLLPAAVLSFFTMSENGQGILMGGLLLFTPVIILICSLSGLQIVENGIWHHATLLRWEEITGYRWTGESNSHLILQSEKILFKGALPPLPVPPEQKAAVNELLQKYLPAGS